VSDLKLAPFHLLATEGQVEIQRDHVWQMEKLAEICKASDGSLGGRVIIGVILIRWVLFLRFVAHRREENEAASWTAAG